MHIKGTIRKASFMFNITNHNENANHNEISPYACLNGYNQNNKRNGKEAEKREPLCTINETVLNWYSHYAK